MRGLTDKQRLLLTDAARPLSDPLLDEIEASPDEQSCFDDLVASGRAVVVARENAEWTWEEWLATDLGRLALRVCPAGEP